MELGLFYMAFIALVSCLLTAVVVVALHDEHAAGWLVPAAQIAVIARWIAWMRVQWRKVHR